MPVLARTATVEVTAISESAPTLGYTARSSAAELPRALSLTHCWWKIFREGGECDRYREDELALSAWCAQTNTLAAGEKTSHGQARIFPLTSNPV